MGIPLCSWRCFLSVVFTKTWETCEQKANVWTKFTTLIWMNRHWPCCLLISSFLESLKIRSRKRQHTPFNSATEIPLKTFSFVIFRNFIRFHIWPLHHEKNDSLLISHSAFYPTCSFTSIHSYITGLRQSAFDSHSKPTNLPNVSESGIVQKALWYFVWSSCGKHGSSLGKNLCAFCAVTSFCTPEQEVDRILYGKCVGNKVTVPDFAAVLFCACVLVDHNHSVP